MNFLKNLLKALFILAMVSLPAIPFFLQSGTFHRDQKRKISYKRFRLVVYTLFYAIAVTLVMCLLRDVAAWFASLRLVQWFNSLQFVQTLKSKLALSTRTAYFGRVIAVLAINFLIGFVHWLLGKLVRIGLKKKDLTTPKGKNGKFNWKQRAERAVIRFFCTETWFFVARVLKYVALILSAAYALIFAVDLMPAVFAADWINYDFISEVFRAGYLYPVITLLVLWESYFFLEGLRRLEEECPGLISEDGKTTTLPVDLQAIDEEVRKQFRDYYVCNVQLSETPQDEVAASHHCRITEMIGEAVEHDARHPHRAKEIYLNCLDRLTENEGSLLINGTLFSEFSMYFLRYLSVTAARGDNIVFVCADEAQIDAVERYLREGFVQISSLFCKGFQSEGVNFDNPIWRIVKIDGKSEELSEAAVDDNSILVTTLAYLCSNRFESEHSAFIHLLDTVVFVDTMRIVNADDRRLAMLNTRLRNITRGNALLAMNGSVNRDFRVRYMSKQVRYICFDDTRTPGLDKVLKNLLSVPFESVDSMARASQTLVRCYNYEARTDENGRRICPQFLGTDERLGALMNVAILCLLKGASNVTVFAEDAIPYGNIEETIAANAGKLNIKVDGNCLRLNKPFYDTKAYSVVIVMDHRNDLPTAMRKYRSMLSDEPALLLIFSAPYLLRDYYLANINKLRESTQLERIPVAEGTQKDAAQKILVKANAGGISEDEILRIALEVENLREAAEQRDINGILRAVLKSCGIECDAIELFRYFEYSSSRDFDENGVYSPCDKVLLRRRGRLFDLVSGTNAVVMLVGERQIELPLPKSRLTQNFIVGQNLLYDGNIYHITAIDAGAGRIYARLAVGGKNDEAFRYLPSREYRLEPDSTEVQNVLPTKHIVLQREEDAVCVDDVYLSVRRVPMEVLTAGYFEIDPLTLTVDIGSAPYHSISDPGNDDYAKQTYRRYGLLTEPTYSVDALLRVADASISRDGALTMSIRLKGRFGADSDKTALLAAVMLSEVLKSMFPSARDSIAVCPVLRGGQSVEDANTVLKMLPRLTLLRENEQEGDAELELIIIEDCAEDLGVISVLMSAGDNVMKTLFRPIYDYLAWYSSAETGKSDYLHFGLGHEPDCFDFASVQRLAKLLSDDGHAMSFIEPESVTEYVSCDFCGKRYANKEELLVLADGRKMCRTCAENLVGKNKRLLKAHLDRARVFMESTYGITLDDDFDVCFESTVQIVNALKQDHSLVKRGADIPLRSYVDKNGKIHAEYSIPSANLSELLVRELTYIWQLKHLPQLDEELAEGHIALVGVQYLRFLRQESLAQVRATYYETGRGDACEGYRRLVKELLRNPQFRNNPFRYLLSLGGQEEAIPDPPPIDPSEYGLPYTPEKPERDGEMEYFYYVRLSETKQRVYELILRAIKAFAPSVTVDGCTFEDVEQIVDSIRYDHPELFWFKTFSMRGSEVTLRYAASQSEAMELQRPIDEAVARYLEGIDLSTMSSYDIALRIHARVIAAVDYDTIGLERQKKAGGPSQDKIDYLRTICGVFLNGKAVCEGYARAVQYLLQKCGIECVEAVGHITDENGEASDAHAWILVRLDGDYYHMDTTWDDSSNTVQTARSEDTGLSYFCITTEEIERSRMVDLCPVPLPKCTATRCNYYWHNGLILEKYDPASIKRFAQKAAESRCDRFTFKCTSRKVFDEALDRLCANGQDCFEAIRAAARKNARIQTSGFTYTYNKAIRTVTVKFKLK